ncbi:MAG: GAK system XXXCH domain-containing protein [Candidatus Brocadiales bacterium]|nr:GAK system XXXCH domain-containing protein [Candidatus Brocadiales bacterium]
MSDSNKQKQEFYLSVKETAEKLRTLADELERGVVTINDEKFQIAADTDVKIHLKTKGDTFSSKLKFKLESPLPPGDGEDGKEDSEGESTSSTGLAVESYKDLKMRMSKDFKAIKKSCLVEQAIPESDLVERFYHDSKTMCTYPNKGEEFYEAFLKQADSLYEAFNTSDLKAMSSAVESLAQSRSDCHEKNK